MQSYHPQTFWEALQRRVTERRPSLGGPMQHGRALSLDEQKLVVGFAHKFSLDYLRDPENFMVVRDAAQALLGRSFHIVLEPSDTGAADLNGTPETGAIAEPRADAQEEEQRQKNELKQALINPFGPAPQDSQNQRSELSRKDIGNSQVVGTQQQFKPSPILFSPSRGSQTGGAQQSRQWNNLSFRSASEVRIAQALDKRDVLFFPNCKGRLGAPEHRENREADFLVCDKGKWGIFEVDGEPYHPPSRTVEDHNRDRLFKSHGIRVVEHFDASECFENAEGVVEKFLAILSQNG